jgi:hypothetical protein
MKLGTYIIPPETISTAYLIIPLVNGINTTASQIVEVITLILLEWVNKSSWNLVHISFHLRPSQRCTSQITPTSNTNTGAPQIVLFYWLHYAYILNFSIYLSYKQLKLWWKESKRLVLLIFGFVSLTVACIVSKRFQTGLRVVSQVLTTSGWWVPSSRL